jgi:hypothetical protein
MPLGRWIGGYQQVLATGDWTPRTTTNYHELSHVARGHVATRTEKKKKKKNLRRIAEKLNR